jgi:LacI family transcriptional regulator
MPERKPNIYDVAEKAGVSIATVSRVINSPGKVAVETRQKVQSIVASLGFVPHPVASERARTSFKRIGVLTPFFTAYSFVQRLRGVSSAVSHEEYEIITYSVENLEQLDNYLSMLPASQRVDGLILMSLPFPQESARLFLHFGIPMVSIERSYPEFSSVTVDNVAGGRLAAQFLLSKGYRKLAFMGDGGNASYAYSAAERRLMGFSEVLAEEGVELPERCRIFHYFGLEYAYKAARELLTDDAPDAVFAASDFEAVVVVKAARDLGLAIPDDLAVMGFDNIELAGFLDITTIDQHLDESGRTATEILVSELGSERRTARNIQLNLNVVERSTT